MSDIKNITQLNSALTAPINTPAIPKLKTESMEQLKKAAQEFESIFSDIVMKSMRSTVDSSDVMGESDKVEFFQGMLDTEYSKMSSQRNGIGIADAIIRQYSKNIEGHKDVEIKAHED